MKLPAIIEKKIFDTQLPKDDDEKLELLEEFCRKIRIEHTNGSDLKARQKNLKAARYIGSKIKSKGNFESALVILAKAMIDVDDFELALFFIEKLDDDSFFGNGKSGISEELVNACLKSSKLEQATKAFELINKNNNYKCKHYKNRALSNIVKYTARAGDFKQALQMNGKNDDIEYKIRGFGDIAEAQIESGNQQDAKITLRRAIKEVIAIKDEDKRSSFLCGLVQLQVKCDTVENVLIILDGVSGKDYSEALFYVVEALAKKGDFEKAQKNLKKISDDKWHTEALHVIAQLQVEAEDISNAISLISTNKVETISKTIIDESIESSEINADLEKGISSSDQSIAAKYDLINISRGFEIIGGTFIYKVKVLNNTPHRINDIKIQVLSYPNDCLKADTTERTVPKIEPNGGFRSLEFKFTPTHDCVQGVVNSLVTYIDSTETLQTQVVEPIVIKSVCDLLKPLEGSKYEVLDIIDKLKAGAQDELTIAGSAGEMFQRFLDVLPDRNFAITVSDSKELGGRFMGDITAAAKGKYTNENIGLKITVLENEDGGCTVHFKACGNDQSMLPTAVEEVKQILDTKALLIMNIMRTLNMIREACRVDTAHSVLLKLEELKVKIDGEVEPSTIEKLEEVMGIKATYDSIEEQLKDHDQERICVYCDHLEGMLETGLVKK